jgi:regulator of protease activity HflC (stomatin/prohibitin superfamily)
MNAGLDKLLDLFISCFQFFVPFYVIDAYERAVVLRWGHFHQEVGPGFHWCVPFNIDRVLKDNVVARTHTMTAQALTTSDGRTISVTAVITARISDIRKALLEVENMDHALLDACSAAIGAHVAAHTWDSLRTEPAADTLTKACRAGAWRYGVHIKRVQLADLALCRVIRLHASRGADITGSPI